MAINKCTNCGCEDSFLVSPAPCPTPAGCPTPEPCYTVTDAQCAIYTGLDIQCNTDTVVATNTNIADALNNVVTYFCETNTTKLKYVQEFISNLDQDFLTILRSDILACGINPSVCSQDGTEYSDFVVNIWLKEDQGTTWRLLQPYSLGGSWAASIDNNTGDITIFINQAPIDPAVRVRVILIF